jgi:hypothetical protein
MIVDFTLNGASYQWGVPGQAFRNELTGHLATASALASHLTRPSVAAKHWEKCGSWIDGGEATSWRLAVQYVWLSPTWPGRYGVFRLSMSSCEWAATEILWEL